MKKILTTTILLAMFATCTIIKAQTQKEYLGLPGDNLNLYAVMDLFQKSETLEGFERSLNDKDSRLNNLDLNGDNLIDYITVTDHVDGEVHTIVLQDAISRNEKQDVAVFTVQRFNDGTAQIQLIGDEELYGRNYIIEPIYADNVNETPNPGYSENRENITVIRTSPIQVATWPMIRFIYRPNYTVWHSSWYWGNYPTYWHPWNSFSWDYYYGYQHNWYPEYYKYYRHWEQPRYTGYHDFYYAGIRSHSPEVSVRIRDGHYKKTYSHPEQRRDGEVLYTKLHSDRSSTTTGRNTTSSQGRRSESQSTRVLTPSGTNSGTDRRASGTNASKSSGNPSAGQNTNANRRSTNTATERSATRPAPGQNARNTTRSTSTVTEKRSSNNAPGQNAAVTRRSSTSVSNKATSNPPSGQRGEVRAASKPATRASSPNRSNNKVTTSGTAVKRTVKTKETDSGNSERRK